MFAIGIWLDCSISLDIILTNVDSASSQVYFLTNFLVQIGTESFRDAVQIKNAIKHKLVWSIISLLAMYLCKYY